jgi:hypothetical protein
MSSALYEIPVNRIDRTCASLGEYRASVMLIECGHRLAA